MKATLSKTITLFTLFLIMAAHCLMITPLRAEEKQESGKTPLRVGLLQDPPYTYKNRDGRWIGLNADLWRQICQELKWDYRFVEMSRGRILQELKGRRLDLSVAAIHITAAQEKNVDFSMPFGHSRVAVATIKPQDHPWLAAMKIFFSWSTLQVLAVLGAILLLAGLLFWLVERRSNPDFAGEGTLRGIGTGIYWVGSTLASGVCFGVPLRTLTGRIIGLAWMLLCALALSAFIASLTSSLTAQSREDFYMSVPQLERMHLGTVRDDVADDIIRSLGGRYELYDDDQSAIKALLEKRIEGFLFDEVTLNYYAENQYRRRIFVKPAALGNIPFAFAMPSGSRLRKPVNIALLTIMNQPIWEAILSQYGLMDHTELKSAHKKHTRRGLGEKSIFGP